MDLTKELLLSMFWHMLLARRLDERAWTLHREGKIGYHISGIGQEAVQVAAACAIRTGYDWVAPHGRDLALMLVLGLTPLEYFLSLMGKAGAPAAGRQMPGEWSLPRRQVLSRSSIPAAQVAHAVGVALAVQLRGENRVVLAITGEGATGQGEWYESVNWASVKKLPVIFLVENNRYALSLRQEQQMAVSGVADKALGLGLPGLVADGNDLTQLFPAISQAIERARHGLGPTLIEARTFRVTPHSSDDDDRTYRSRQEVENSRRQDPLLRARTLLEAQGYLTTELLHSMDAKAAQIVDQAVQTADQAPWPEATQAGAHLYASEEVVCRS